MYMYIRWAIFTKTFLKLPSCSTLAKTNSQYRLQHVRRTTSGRGGERRIQSHWRREACVSQDEFIANYDQDLGEGLRKNINSFADNVVGGNQTHESTGISKDANEVKKGLENAGSTGNVTTGTTYTSDTSGSH